MGRKGFKWTVGRRLALGFGTVTAIFVVAIAVALAYSASAGSAWRAATRWDRAVAGSNRQLRGTQQQMAAQALYVATGAPRYKAEWEQGVAMSDGGAAAVDALHDPTIARIANTANAADHKHDAAVNKHLFPAVAAGDHAASLAALKEADTFVRVPLGAQRKIATYVAGRRATDVAHAKAAERAVRRAGLLAALVGVLLATGVAFLITRRVVRPLRVVVDRLTMLRDVCVTRLNAGLTALAHGDLTVAAEPETPEIADPGTDEVGDVARAFNEIRAKTVESLSAYTESRGRLAALIGEVSVSAGTAVGGVAADGDDLRGGRPRGRRDRHGRRRGRRRAPSARCARSRQAQAADRGGRRGDAAQRRQRAGDGRRGRRSPRGRRARAPPRWRRRPRRWARCATARRRRPRRSASWARSPSRSAGSSRRSRASPSRRTCWR